MGENAEVVYETSEQSLLISIFNNKLILNGKIISREEINYNETIIGVKRLLWKYSHKPLEYLYRSYTIKFMQFIIHFLSIFPCKREKISLINEKSCMILKKP